MANKWNDPAREKLLAASRRADAKADRAKAKMDKAKAQLAAAEAAVEAATKEWCDAIDGTIQAMRDLGAPV